MYKHGNSSENVGRIASRASGGTNYSEPRAQRTQVSNNRGESGLGHPLQRTEPAAARLRPGPRPGHRTVVDAAAANKAVRRSFCIYTTIGIIMICILVFGCLFGVIIAIVLTHGALSSNVSLPTSSPFDTTCPSVGTTFVPSTYSTLVPSSFSTLVPSEVTIYVPSDATTLVHSDAITLVPSVITIAQQDATAPAQVAEANPTTPTQEIGKVTSTTGLVISVTTTITVPVYSTYFGRYAHQGEHISSGDSLQMCIKGTQNTCMLTTDVTQAIQNSFITSTRSTASTSLLDVGSIIATTVDAPNSGTTTATAAISATDSSSDQVANTYSMMCTVTDSSSLLPYNPVATDWYISPSAPRATSLLHPVFRFISSALRCVADTGTYQVSRLSKDKAWNQCGKLFVNNGAGKLLDNILDLASLRKLRLDLYGRVMDLGNLTAWNLPDHVLREG